MINSALLPIVLAALSLTLAAGPATAAPSPDVKAVSTAGSDFGFRLLHVLATDHPAGGGPNANVFFSPFSVSQALTLAMSGAGGQTRADMAKTLGLDALTQDKINAANADLLPALMSDPKVQISVANSLWVTTGWTFSQGFQVDAEKFYHAQATTLNFKSPGAAAAINDWVRENTRGRITRIVTPDDLKYATNVLANTVYFHGQWQTPFEPINTKTEPFHLDSGGTKPVSLMEQFSQFAYLDTPQFQAASLPYGTGRTSMTVFLPKPGVSVETLALSLTGETATQWLKSMQQTGIILYLPRFKADTKALLKEPLSTLGMKLAFSNSADFTRMCSLPTSLGEVLHIATLGVDEQGTVAAAATATIAAGAGAVPSAPPPPPPIMRVDRPFLALIRDTETGTLLFAGVIRDPK